ncbi:MAG: lipid A 3-O-deacylase [Alphaproteobacteria bacterium]|jgi:lipid A 3-O-deacylase
MNSWMNNKLITLCLFTLFTQNAFSVENTKTFKEKLPAELLVRHDKFLSLTYENDVFANNDANYTNGIRFTYFDTNAEVPQLVKDFFNMAPIIEIDNFTSVYYSFGQNLYTPKVITARTPDPSDRPYAGYLYGSVGLRAISGDHINDLELSLGVVGPSSLGEQTQEFVHDMIDATDPSGWENNQLKDEPAIIIAYNRQWPEMFATDIGPFHFRVSPNLGAAIGNVYTYASTGMTFQLTPKAYKWQTTPLRVRPSMPGSGYFIVPDNKFAWSTFAGFEQRAIARNIFLDGNSYKDSTSVDKKTFVGDANVGLSLTYGRVQTSFTINWRGREFQNGRSTTFGALSVGYRL